MEEKRKVLFRLYDNYKPLQVELSVGETKVVNYNGRDLDDDVWERG